MRHGVKQTVRDIVPAALARGAGLRKADVDDARFGVCEEFTAERGTQSPSSGSRKGGKEEMGVDLVDFGGGSGRRWDWRFVHGGCSGHLGG